MARKIYFLPTDLVDTIFGRRHKYQPKKGDIFIGSGDFIEQGRHHLNLLKHHVSLHKNDKILDIGSGIGRTAIALTSFLSKNAHYQGFDVVKKGIDWCNNTISKDFPNFQFTYIPLNNDLYNSHTTKAADFKFPYTTGYFDKAFLFSVFTHMSLEDIQNYLNEIHRVLQPKGQCLATFFIYNSEDKEQPSSLKDFNFPFQFDGYRLMDKKVTAANIAIYYKKLQDMAKTAGLRLVSYTEGSWKDHISHKNTNDFQDIVVFQKHKL